MEYLESSSTQKLSRLVVCVCVQLAHRLTSHYQTMAMETLDILVCSNMNTVHQIPTLVTSTESVACFYFPSAIITAVSTICMQYLVSLDAV